MIKQPATLSMIVISLCPPLSPLVYSVRNLQAKLLLPGPFKTGADQVGTGPWPDGNDTSLLLSQRAPDRTQSGINYVGCACLRVSLCVYLGRGGCEAGEGICPSQKMSHVCGVQEWIVII